MYWQIQRIATLLVTLGASAVLFTATIVLSQYIH